MSSVTIASTCIILTLASPVTYGQTVTLTIDRDGTNHLRASAGTGSKIAVPVSCGKCHELQPDAAAAATFAELFPGNQISKLLRPETTTGLPGSLVFPRHLGRGNMGMGSAGPVPAYRQEQA